MKPPNAPTKTENRTRAVATLFATLVVAIVQTVGSRADVIPIPTSGVTASSEIPGFNRLDDYIVDGSGLTGGAHDLTPDGFMWLSRGGGFGGDDPDPSVTFDLGAVYTVTSFHVWNYNEVGDFRFRGVNAVSVDYGTTAALGSTVPGITNFAVATGAAGDTGEEFDAFAPFSARFIKFDIDSNHGGDNNFYGLSEVQFDGTPSGVLISPHIILTSATLGVTVGILTTPTGDVDDTFSYALVAGEGDSDNDKFQIAGDELQAGDYDFSTAVDGTQFSVRVESTGSPSGEQIESVLTIIAAADSDADGLLDRWEEMWAGAGNLEILSGLGGADADGDMLTDLRELELGGQFPDLDPTAADSDGDDLEDGEEVAGAGSRPPTDPTDPDTDDDNLTDEVETNTGIDNGPSDTGSNPTLVDSDGDGHDDGIEVVKGSNPNDPNSVPPVIPSEFIPISPSGVTASSEIPGFDRIDDYLVDGSGLADGEHGVTPDAFMWLSTGTAFGGDDPDPSVIFDLGEVYTITSFHVWNYNEVGAFALRGVNGVSVEYGTTAALGSTVPGITNFAVATGAAGDTGEEFDAFAPFVAQFIKFDIDSNHGGDNQFYGLSEVQFKGTLGSDEFAITDIIYDPDAPADPPHPAGPRVTLTFTSHPGQIYAIDFSTSLKAESWTELDDGVVSEGSETTYIDTQAAGLGPRIFYRARELE